MHLGLQRGDAELRAAVDAPGGVPQLDRLRPPAAEVDQVVVGTAPVLLETAHHPCRAG
jgi:hypothetical protein